MLNSNVPTERAEVPADLDALQSATVQSWFKLSKEDLADETVVVSSRPTSRG